MYRGGVEFLEPQPREKIPKAGIGGKVRNKPKQARSIQHIHSRSTSHGDTSNSIKRNSRKPRSASKALAKDLVIAGKAQITHLDGVNRFIALLAEGLRKLGHEIEIFSWCYSDVKREKPDDDSQKHGSDTNIPIDTLCKVSNESYP